MDYTIWVTNSCNMKCKYCYVQEMKGQKFFSKEDIGLLIEFIKRTCRDDKDIKINFFGGEPLLNFELIQTIINKLEKEHFTNIYYSLTTNGLLLDENNIQYIKEKQIALSLSWDGNEEANDYNRIDLSGKGTYKRIREKYNLLKKHGIKNIRIRATFNSNTMKLLKSSIQHFLDVDKEISVIFVADFFDAKWDENKVDELQSIVNEIGEMNLHNILVLGDKTLINSSCGGGLTSYHIYADGCIYPCSFVVNNPEFCIGNISNGIDENKRKKLINHYKNRVSECSGCEYEAYCLSYRCKYLNWALTGDFNQAAPIVCRFENIKMCNNI